MVKGRKDPVLAAYAILLLITVAAHLPHLGYLFRIIPPYLFAAPLLIQRRIQLSFSAKDLALGFGVSALLLLPFYFFFPSFRPDGPLTVGTVLVQLLAVALPEEVFFRGFIQHSMGGSYRAVVMASALFAIAHIPAMLFQHDRTALLTFFPSLVMGLLYQRTGNILPSVVFHFLANVPLWRIVL